MFIDVRVVAGGAIEPVGEPEAFAGREQAVLVAMDIKSSGGRCVVGCRGVVIEGISYGKRKRGQLLVAEPRVAEGAGVEALLTAEMPGVDNIFGGTFGGMRGLPGDMLRCGAMATFAIDAIKDAGTVEHRPQIGQFSHFCMCSMAFQTLPEDLLAEINHIARISGAVTPAVERNKVRNGQLEKPVPIPI